MPTRRGVSAVLAVLLSAGWLLGAPGAAFAVKEREPLTGPPCGSGPTVGKVVIKDLESGGVKVKVRIKNGTPNATYDALWHRMDAPRSCDFGIGEKFLGSLTTDGLGKGRFVIVLPGGNPFPGGFVLIWLEGNPPPHLFAPFANVFQ